MSNQIGKRPAMRAVFKYPLDVRETTVTMPEDAKVLLIDSQDDGEAILKDMMLQVWAEVEVEPIPGLGGLQPVHKARNWNFAVFGTGHPIIAPELSHLASVQAGAFVWHVYERNPA